MSNLENWVTLFLLFFSRYGILILISWTDRKIEFFEASKQFYLAFRHYEFSFFSPRAKMGLLVRERGDCEIRRGRGFEIKVSWTHRVNLRETCSFCYFFF